MQVAGSDICLRAAAGLRCEQETGTSARNSVPKQGLRARALDLVGPGFVSWSAANSLYDVEPEISLLWPFSLSSK